MSITELAPVSKFILLEPVSWLTFNQLLQDLGEKRGIRLAYCQGTLEIMTPLGEHEHNNRFLERLIYTAVDILNLEIKSLGSLTLRVNRLEKGIEPDSCFYLQNEPIVRHKRDIDLNVDPPPDLVIEIDITSSSLNKLAIYGALGVPEIWRYDGRTLQAYLWNGIQQVYQISEQSLALHPLKVKDLTVFLRQSLQDGETATIRQFRQWLIKQLDQSE
ncbi:Uma2 family endonuclease [Synechocystis salina LEGE 06155]|nr:Uma2 family endonuclease [Synechocystis salina LEGE 06155]